MLNNCINKIGFDRGPLQLVVASHLEDVGMEVVAPEQSASTLGPGAF
jgi:hypothetical protein